MRACCRPKPVRVRRSRAFKCAASPDTRRDALQHRRSRSALADVKLAPSCRRSSRSSREPRLVIAPPLCRGCGAARLRRRCRADKSAPPVLTAVFSSTSYAPGSLATLRVLTSTSPRPADPPRRRRAGVVERRPPVGPGATHPFSPLGVNPCRVRLGRVAERPVLRAAHTRRGRQARSRRSSFARAVWARSRVAVVLPTLQLAGLQLLRRGRDGNGDSWYVDTHASTCSSAARSSRGMPPHYRTHAARFPPLPRAHGPAGRLPDRRGPRARRSGDDLAALYDLIIFSGHEEYVTHARSTT